MNIIYQGPNIQPTNNQFLISASGNTSLGDNYQYIFDVYVKDNNNLTGSSIFEARILKYPNQDNEGIVDIQTIANNYVGFDSPSATTVFPIVETKKRSSLNVEIGQQYINSTGATVTTTGITTSNEIIFYNARINNYDWIDWRNIGIFNDYAQGLFDNNYILEYDVLSGLTNALITPKIDYKVTLDDNHYLSFLRKIPNLQVTGTSLANIRVDKYNSNNIILDSVQRSVQTNNELTNINNLFFQIGVGPEQINTTTGWTTPQTLSTDLVALRLSPIIDSNVAYYDVWLRGAELVSGTTYQFKDSSVKYRFYIQGCNKYPIYRLFWYNYLSGWDGFSFTRKDKIQNVVNSNQYIKPQAYLYGYDDEQKIKTNFNIERTITIISDWLSKSEAQYVSGIFKSPKVYLQQDNQLIPIYVDTSRYREYTNQSGLFNFEFDIQFTNNEYFKGGI